MITAAKFPDSLTRMTRRDGDHAIECADKINNLMNRRKNDDHNVLPAAKVVVVARIRRRRLQRRFSRERRLRELAGRTEESEPWRPWPLTCR
jgi:hypothetical protein